MRFAPRVHFHTGTAPVHSCFAPLIAPAYVAARSDAVHDAAAEVVRNGMVLERTRLGLTDSAEGPWAVLDPTGRLIAVYQEHRNSTVKPSYVLSVQDDPGPDPAQH